MGSISNFSQVLCKFDEKIWWKTSCFTSDFQKFNFTTYNVMKLVVLKNHLWSQILYRSLDPTENSIFDEKFFDWKCHFWRKIFWLKIPFLTKHFLTENDIFDEKFHFSVLVKNGVFGKRVKTRCRIWKVLWHPRSFLCWLLANYHILPDHIPRHYFFIFSKQATKIWL